MTLLAEQVLNGVQFGVMLFLLAAGLTLVFGIMGLINLAHASLYMIGAFGAARLAAFGRDLKLVHRVGGYLGRPGLPLADHLIAAVVRPAAESVARQGPP